jgi:hypothetical protein
MGSFAGNLIEEVLEVEEQEGLCGGKTLMGSWMN